MNTFYFIVVFFSGVVFAAELTPCTTPNGEAASCVPLIKCIVLIQVAASNTPDALKFLQESVCDEETSKVCCGTSGNYTNPSATSKPLRREDIFADLSQQEKKEYVLGKLLPNTTYCGLQHTDDYYYSATETSVDEFPWLVYIIERNLQHDVDFYLRVEANCVGVLISNRYVLSSKDCRTYAQWYAASDNIYMILGLHHIHKKINCVGTQYGIDDCTEPPVHVSSAQWKLYEQVVLFRLTEKVSFSDFIRPICLPLQANEIPSAGSLVIASGWSEEEFVSGKSLKLKKRMKYTVMSEKECQTNNPLKNAICGIPLETNTHYFCTGDTGGPLMYRHEQRNWFAVGLLLQTAINLCDEAQPATAIRLTPEIMNWIIENIEP